MLLAGLSAKSRWKKDVAFTRPYVETRTVVGVPPGFSYPDDFAQVPVAVELGTEEEGLLEQRTDALVRPLRELAGNSASPPQCRTTCSTISGSTDSGTELAADKHVMAVKLGENALLVRLERFLLNREGEIRRLLEREGRP